MKKRWLIICIVSIFVVAAAVIFTVSKNGEEYNVIDSKETALKIGMALLEERFPDSFNYGFTYDAEDLGKTWRVRNVVQTTGCTEEGTMWVTSGGVIYVEFRKRDGKVIDIGLAE